MSRESATWPLLLDRDRHLAHRRLGFAASGIAALVSRRRSSARTSSPPQRTALLRAALDPEPLAAALAALRRGAADVDRVLPRPCLSPADVTLHAASFAPLSVTHHSVGGGKQANRRREARGPTVVVAETGNGGGTWQRTPVATANMCGRREIGRGATCKARVCGTLSHSSPGGQAHPNRPGPTESKQQIAERQRLSELSLYHREGVRYIYRAVALPEVDVGMPSAAVRVGA